MNIFNWFWIFWSITRHSHLQLSLQKCIRRGNEVKCWVWMFSQIQATKNRKAEKKQTMVFLNNECCFPSAIRVFYNLTNPFSFQSIPHSPPTRKCQKVPVWVNSELRNDFLNMGSDFLNVHTPQMDTYHCPNWCDENCLAIYPAINLKRTFQQEME